MFSSNCLNKASSTLSGTHADVRWSYQYCSYLRICLPDCPVKVPVRLQSWYIVQFSQEHLGLWMCVWGKAYMALCWQTNRFMQCLNMTLRSAQSDLKLSISVYKDTRQNTTFSCFLTMWSNQHLISEELMVVITLHWSLHLHGNQSYLHYNNVCVGNQILKLSLKTVRLHCSKPDTNSIFA